LPGDSPVLPSRPLLLGHRGARRYAPENTLAAFDLALSHGCDGFEFDVRLTRDQRGLICHDARLGRRSIARTGFKILQERRRGEPLACIDDVITRYAARAFLDIELKVRGLEAQIASLVSSADWARGYVVSSFVPAVLRELHVRDAGIRTGLIAESRHGLRLWDKLAVSVVMPNMRLVTRALVEELHSAGKQVLVWTVNRERTMRRMAGLGVDGIISDDTALLCRVFGLRPARQGT
jgi:glycerophosphoryl diester phosphodiesterase